MSGFARGDRQTPGRVRAERQRRLSHQRLGNRRRHRAVESVRRDRGRARGAGGCLLQLARRQLRHRLRRVQRSGLGLLSVCLRRRRPALVGRGRLPPQRSLPGRLLGRRGQANRDVADSARQYEDEGSEQHERALPGQSSGVAAGRTGPYPSGRVPGRRRRRFPVRRRRERVDVRLQCARTTASQIRLPSTAIRWLRNRRAGIGAGPGDAGNHADPRHAIRGQ